MKTTEMPVISLEGDPRERGRQYGEAAESLIADTVTAWRSNLGSFGKGSVRSETVDTDCYLTEFYQQTDYINAVKHWTPHLYEEVQGIADGAEQPFEWVLGLQLMDEEWLFGLRNQMTKPTEKCTAFAAVTKEKTYAGQNMDIGAWTEGRQVLLRIAAEGSTPEILLFSIAGSLGLNGINAKGIGITCNTLAQLNYSTDGLPVAFIVRAALAASSIDEAEQFLYSVKHASGQNYILSSSGDIRCYECCATGVVRYQPDKQGQRLFHTNHPLANTDLNTLFKPAEQASQDSMARLCSIDQRLNQGKDIDLASIQGALSAHDNPVHPVSRELNRQGNAAIGYTAGSSIYEFSDPPVLHLASGPPCQTEYQVFNFISSNRCTEFGAARQSLGRRLQ